MTLCVGQLVGLLMSFEIKVSWFFGYHYFIIWLNNSEIKIKFDILLGVVFGVGMQLQIWSSMRKLAIVRLFVSEVVVKYDRRLQILNSYFTIFFNDGGILDIGISKITMRLLISFLFRLIWAEFVSNIRTKLNKILIIGN